MSRRGVRAWVPVVLAIAMSACGGKSPATPITPTPTPPANTPPVIDSIAVQGTRASLEPADFADLGEGVQVTATVHDAETPVDQLEYQWSAPVGTFSGTGASATWQAPASASTPMDVTITLTVIEHFGSGFTNQVTGTDTVSLHDSAGEVGGMARQFLLDFSDSNITDVSYVMRNFDPTCKGTQDESGQVSDNRRKFFIEKSAIGTPTVMIPFGDASCPIPGRPQRGDACSYTPSHWESKVLINNHVQVADGNDWISAYYRPASRGWKLCDSQFPGVCTDITIGVACANAPQRVRGMTPDSWERFLIGRGK